MEFEENSITMYDEEGNEVSYGILATKNEDGCIYMLAEEETEGDESEVLIFKCVDDGESEEMIFELVEEDHEFFERAFDLFKEDFDELGIEY